ncbi:TPA: hypothetical protein ACGGS3_000613 [Vibrio cholerae]
MNGRQFKKLCKRAAAVMIKVEPKLKSQLILSEERGCEPEIGQIYKWDINTLRQNWRWKAGKDKTPDSLPKGIAGFGCWDGYYEPAIEFACHAINNHVRLTEENKRLREALEKIQRMQSRTPELPEDYTHEDVGDLNDRIDEVFGIVNTAL